MTSEPSQVFKPPITRNYEEQLSLRPTPDAGIH